VIPIILAIDHSNLVIDSRVERLATELAHKSNNHHLAVGKSPSGLAVSHLYFAAIVLGVNLILSSIPGGFRI
jgi:transcription initiation factor TFIIB